MSRRALHILVVILSLALLAACFRIYTLSETVASTRGQNQPVPQTSGKTPPARTDNSSAPSESTNRAANNTRSSNDYAQEQDYAQGSNTIDYRALPREAQTVIQMIQQRAQFTHRQDGSVFSNRERILPQQSRGYYQEYTVPTPGESTRGARRIVAGQGNTGDVATAGEYYYTADHYRSFARVRME